MHQSAIVEHCRTASQVSAAFVLDHTNSHTTATKMTSMKRQTDMLLERQTWSERGEIQALLKSQQSSTPSLPAATGLTCSSSLNHQAGLDSHATLLEKLHHLGVCQSLHGLLVNLHNQVPLAQARAAQRLQHLFDSLARGAVRDGEAKTIHALHHGQGQ